MPIVELIYDADCPNVEKTREQLQRAFADVGLKPQWQEWNRGAVEDRVVAAQKTAYGCEWEQWNQHSGDAPTYVGNFGSPTILIDGKDVAGGSTSQPPDCCRVYRDPNGELRGVPSVEIITAALRDTTAPAQTTREKQKGTSRNWWAVVPAVGMTLLPNVTCPACWPAYAALLSSLGVSVVVTMNYLFPNRSRLSRIVPLNSPHFHLDSAA